MSQRDALFGTDLRLFNHIDLRHSDRDPGSDLYVRASASKGLVERTDLDTFNGVQNLQQALVLRFLTPLGDLEVLGHPDYGSRLYTLIGELNNETTRNRAKLYVLQALQAEPRVKQVVSVTVTQNQSVRTQMDIKAQLLAIDGSTPLNLVFGFSLQGGGIQ